MNTYALFTLILGVGLGVLMGLRLRARRSGDGTVTAARTSTGGKGEASLEILDHMDVGVLVLDDRLRPISANSAGRALLGLERRALPGHLPSPPVTDVARRARDAKEPGSDLVSIAFPQKRTLRVQASPLVDRSQILVVLQDVSEEMRTQTMRREFVAHASHELKSPVASLQALTEAVIQALSDDPAEAARFAQRLLAESERMGKLVTDLLDLSRLEEPGEIVREDCDLSKITAKEADLAEADAVERGLVLSRGIEEGLLLSGDAGQLRLLVRNLLDNAIQYTPEGGTVHLDVRRAGDSVRLRVEDSGIGIPVEARSRIFERFYRVDRARSRARGGTGLGLAIVKHVTELHKGKIELQSEVGRGSIFEIVLPEERTETEKESA